MNSILCFPLIPFHLLRHCAQYHQVPTLFHASCCEPHPQSDYSLIEHSKHLSYFRVASCPCFYVHFMMSCFREKVWKSPWIGSVSLVSQAQTVCHKTCLCTVSGGELELDSNCVIDNILLAFGCADSLVLGPVGLRALVYSTFSLLGDCDASQGNRNTLKVERCTSYPVSSHGNIRVGCNS